MSIQGVMGMSTIRTSLRGSFALLALVAAGSFGLGGCASHDYSYEAAEEIRDNPSPELDTLWQRRVDMDNTVALTGDENLRMLNEDWGRLWLMERPSRLSYDQFRR